MQGVLPGVQVFLGMVKGKRPLVVLSVSDLVLCRKLTKQGMLERDLSDRELIDTECCANPLRERVRLRCVFESEAGFLPD